MMDGTVQLKPVFLLVMFISQIQAFLTTITSSSVLPLIVHSRCGQLTQVRQIIRFKRKLVPRNVNQFQFLILNSLHFRCRFGLDFGNARP